MDALGVARAGEMPRWAKYALVLIAVWSVPGLIQATSTYVVYSLKGEDMSYAAALAWRLPEWMVWAAATPAIVILGRRFTLSRPWPSIPIHLLANTVFAICDVTMYWVGGRLVGDEYVSKTSLLELMPWMLLKSAFIELLVYWAVIAADHGLSYQRRYRESELRQSQLEARLVEAQLDALKMQLHPHFLFNTINAVTVLMRKGESAAAVRMLGGLSELLRRSLASLRVEFVSLNHELDFIERYLDIETTRFPDRLSVAFDIEATAQRARVPNLILQPIVENAIEHGIAPRVSGGRIDIIARVVTDDPKSPDRAVLRIEVRDDGVGLGKSPASGHGVGLSHVRKRLAQLYPGTHRFTLEPGDASGTIAIVEFPFEEEAR